MEFVITGCVSEANENPNENPAATLLQITHMRRARHVYDFLCATSFLTGWVALT